jgi:hypothetical protein
LDESIRRTSSDMPKSWQRMNRSSYSGSERSLSPMPAYSGVRMKKFAAVEANEEAARSILWKEIIICLNPRNLIAYTSWEKRLINMSRRQQCTKWSKSRQRESCPVRSSRQCSSALKWNTSQLRRQRRCTTLSIYALNESWDGHLILCQRIPYLTILCHAMKIARALMIALPIIRDNFVCMLWIMDKVIPRIIMD